MKFSQYNISDLLIKNLTEAGFKRPTDIQYKAIPSILEGEDILAIAQTGTGKTAAFAVPVINKIINHKKKSPKKKIRCLIMVPTRELAKQISGVLNQLSKGTRIKVTTIYGGVDQDNQVARLKNGTDILVATPGRMFDLIHQGYIDLKHIDTLVVDEADRMLDLGFLKDIQDVLRFIPARRQTLFFSATIDKKIKKLAYSLVSSTAIRIHLSPKDPVSKNVSHSVAMIPMEDKRFFLERVVNEHPGEKILAFVRTKVRAERVCSAMERVDIKALSIHGDKGQEERFSALDQFKEGTINLLVATDVSARGIDIPNVTYVVNYDIPDVDENYVHRVGRTGRGNNKGFAVSFCSDEETELLKAVEDYVGYEIPRLSIDNTTYEETIDFSEESDSNWQQLLKDEKESKTKKRKKKKKK